MRWLWTAVLIGACAVPTPGAYARTQATAGTLRGAKLVTIIGPNPRLNGDLQRALEAHGFRVLLGVDGTLVTPYFVRVDGDCWSGLNLGDLRVELFAAKTDERLFFARLSSNDFCPRMFFEDVAGALLAEWGEQPSSDVPTPSATTF